jgi:cell wall-associated NlpC family hydrolase
MTVLRQAMKDPRVLELLATVGTPYHWGRGDPRTLWPPEGCDCSGFANCALVHLRMLRATEPDRNAHNLAMISDPVDDGRLGDLAFYGGQGISHVMLCLGGDWVVGASGGGPKTVGTDPRAYVQLRPLDYRADLVTVGRIKPDFHP